MQNHSHCHASMHVNASLQGALPVEVRGTAQGLFSVMTAVGNLAPLLIGSLASTYPLQRVVHVRRQRAAVLCARRERARRRAGAAAAAAADAAAAIVRLQTGRLCRLGEQLTVAAGLTARRSSAAAAVRPRRAARSTDGDASAAQPPPLAALLKVHRNGMSRCRRGAAARAAGLRIDGAGGAIAKREQRQLKMVYCMAICEEDAAAATLRRCCCCCAAAAHACRGPALPDTPCARAPWLLLGEAPKLAEGQQAQVLHAPPVANWHKRSCGAPDVRCCCSCAELGRRLLLCTALWHVMAQLQHQEADTKKAAPAADHTISDLSSRRETNGGGAHSPMRAPADGAIKTPAVGIGADATAHAAGGGASGEERIRELVKAGLTEEQARRHVEALGVKGGALKGDSATRAALFGSQEDKESLRRNQTLLQNLVHEEHRRAIQEVYELAGGKQLGSPVQHDMQSFQVEDKCEGGFGKVQIVTRKATGKDFALKTVELDRVRDKKSFDFFMKEVDIMKNLDHPNIVRLQEVFHTPDYLFLVMDLCTGGNLLQSYKFKTERAAADIVRNIVNAIRYCHDRGIAHRDLKLDNIVYEHNGPDAEVKLVDFGLSCHYTEAQLEHDVVGTWIYMAPEVIGGSHFPTACDMWSIGVIAYLLLCGYPPFSGETRDKLKWQIRHGTYKFHDSAWRHITPLAKSFITRLLVRNPQERMTAAEAQHHPWISTCAKELADAPLSAEVAANILKFQNAKLLKKLALKTVARAMEDDQVRELEREFAKADSQNAGVITMADLKVLLKRALGDGSSGIDPSSLKMTRGNGRQSVLFRRGSIAPEKLQDIFDAVDVDGSGAVSLNGFIAACMSRRKLDEQRLKLAFDRLDYDQNGTISVDDLELTVGTNASADELKLTVGTNASADELKVSKRCGTGAGLKVSTAIVNFPQLQHQSIFYPESSWSAPTAWDELKNAIAEFDSNGDGVIDFKEFCAAMRNVEDIGMLDLAMTNRRSFTETVRRMSAMEKVAIVQRGSDELRGVRMAEALVEVTEPSEGDMAANLADLSLADHYQDPTTDSATHNREARQRASVLMSAETLKHQGTLPLKDKRSATAALRRRRLLLLLRRKMGGGAAARSSMRAAAPRVACVLCAAAAAHEWGSGGRDDPATATARSDEITLTRISAEPHGSAEGAAHRPQRALQEQRQRAHSRAAAAPPPPSPPQRRHAPMGTCSSRPSRAPHSPPAKPPDDPSSRAHGAKAALNADAEGARGAAAAAGGGDGGAAAAAAAAGRGEGGGVQQPGGAGRGGEAASQHGEDGSEAELRRLLLVDERRRQSMLQNLVHEEYCRTITEAYDLSGGKKLGAGCFGKVQVITHRASGERYALKMVELSRVRDKKSFDNIMKEVEVMKNLVQFAPLSRVRDEKSFDNIMKEVEVMKNLDHPNIVRLQEVYQTPSYLFLVMDLCTGGNLMQSYKFHSEDAAADIVKSVINAIRYCHDRSIAHRDLKLDNIVREHRGVDAEIKLVDFGLSCHFSESELQHDVVGTWIYMAPEVIGGSHYPTACDMWSIGVIAYLLLCGYPPFLGSTREELTWQIRHGTYQFHEKAWRHISPLAKNFIKRLLVRNPRERMTAAEAQHHPWISSATRNKEPHELPQEVAANIVKFREENLLKKLALKAVARALEPEHVRELETQFCKADTSESGVISLSELRDVLQRSMPGWDRHIAAGSSAHGGGSAGSLSHPSLSPTASLRLTTTGGAMRRGFSSPMPIGGSAAVGGAGGVVVGNTQEEEAAQAIFDGVVMDGSRTLSFNDFMAASMSRRMLDDRSLRLAFDRLDYDHSGAISVDDLELTVGAGADEVTLKAAIKEWDTDGDGAINFQEFCAAMRQKEDVGILDLATMRNRKLARRKLPTGEALQQLTVNASISEQSYEIGTGVNLSETTVGGSSGTSRANETGPVVVASLDSASTASVEAADDLAEFPVTELQDRAKAHAEALRASLLLSVSALASRSSAQQGAQAGGTGAVAAAHRASLGWSQPRSQALDTTSIEVVEGKGSAALFALPPLSTPAHHAGHSSATAAAAAQHGVSAQHRLEQ
ncbi:hypothetical protein JKP88DRAFT_267783 [Tribonema minus]|uniref:Uncharacterized protein n=1 Tax=Tribonema minus TaxID=303371 RepID=A0A835ZF12_9STRA|nr:hypothetical protein JKP88DRAFT_267783 [Tribonema minus]